MKGPMPDIKYWAIAIETAEIHSKAKVFRELVMDTNAARLRRGDSKEDPSTYILYDTRAERDSALEAFKEVYKTARSIYSRMRDN